MRIKALTMWQRSWSTTFALLAIFAWCMPTLAVGCAVMSPAVLLHCSEMNTGVSPDTVEMQQMACCHKVPLPQAQSPGSHSAVLSANVHGHIFDIAYPPPYAPLWALPIISLDNSIHVTNTFPSEDFSPPPVVDAASQLAGRAPPSLI